jgi:short-subunit dehydrogenase
MIRNDRHQPVAVVTGASSGIGRASSVLGVIPAPYSALYSATKHAIEGYSESLDHEVRAFGVRVILIEPAYTRTSFDANADKPDRLIEDYAPARENVGKQVVKAMEAADAPEIVAETVVNGATATPPRHRYAAGKVAKRVSMLRRFVPESAFDKSLRKQLSLPA